MIIPVSISGSTFTASGRFPFADGQQVMVDSRIPNQVPAPLVDFDTNQTRVFYYVIGLTGNQFQLSATVAGPAITLTGTGVGQISVSEFPPLTWDQLSSLPLLDVSELRDFFTTPESLIQLTAAPDTPIGVTVASSVFTSGIPHNLTDWATVQFSTSGTLPAPLVAGVSYYARDLATDSAFKVASVIGGGAITITTAGTGQTSVQNYSLNVVLEKRIKIATSDVYDALLLKVSNHMKFVSRSWWWWFTPPTAPVDTIFYPVVNRSLIVLDNLWNPEKLRKAIRDYAAWNMIQDASWRNLVKDSMFFEQFGNQPESLAKKRAEQRLNDLMPLLLVSGYQGARRIFDFDQTTDSVNISLV